MLRKLRVVTALTVALDVSTTYAEEDYGAIDILLKRDLASIARLEKRWPSVEVDFDKAVNRYKGASLAVKRCQNGFWSVFFKKAFADLDESRRKLEDAHSLIKTANKAASRALSAQGRSLLILEKSFSGKRKDASYWDKKNNIVTAMMVDYHDVLTEIVVPGYEKYSSGITELSEAYEVSAEDCVRTIPLAPWKTLLRDVLEKVVGKIDAVNVIADEILKIVPDKLKKKD